MLPQQHCKTFPIRRNCTSDRLTPLCRSTRHIHPSTTPIQRGPHPERSSRPDRARQQQHISIRARPQPDPLRPIRGRNSQHSWIGRVNPARAPIHSSPDARCDKRAPIRVVHLPSKNDLAPRRITLNMPHTLHNMLARRRPQHLRQIRRRHTRPGQPMIHTLINERPRHQIHNSAACRLRKYSTSSIPSREELIYIKQSIRLRRRPRGVSPSHSPRTTPVSTHARIIMQINTPKPSLIESRRNLITPAQRSRITLPRTSPHRMRRDRSIIPPRYHCRGRKSSNRRLTHARAIPHTCPASTRRNEREPRIARINKRIQQQILIIDAIIHWYIARAPRIPTQHVRARRLRPRQPTIITDHEVRGHRIPARRTTPTPNDHLIIRAALRSTRAYARVLHGERRQTRIWLPQINFKARTIPRKWHPTLPIIRNQITRTGSRRKKNRCRSAHRQLPISPQIHWRKIRINKLPPVSDHAQIQPISHGRVPPEVRSRWI